MKKVFLFVFLFSLSTVFAESKEFTIQMAAKIVYGKTNQEIKSLQETLFDFGYYKVGVAEPVFSGKFDNELKLALVDFQKSNDIKVTGVVDPTTVKTLNLFLEYAREEEESKNQYLTGGENIDDYVSGDEGYSETINYTTDYSDYYSNIPLLKDAIEIISPTKSNDEKTLYLSEKVEDHYTFVGKFNFLECLTDKRCIDLEEIYEEN